MVYTKGCNGAKPDTVQINVTLVMGTDYPPEIMRE